MTKKALILLAHGFEEVEALTPIDFLRRAGVDLLIAGVGGKTIRSSRGVGVVCDALVKDLDAYDFDALILPGGMPGAKNIRESSAAEKCIRSMHRDGRILAAICAAPAVVLDSLGLLEGKRASCYPGFEKQFQGAIFTPERVVWDGNILSSRGPGTAAEFSLALISSLCGEEEAEAIRKKTLQPF